MNKTALITGASRGIGHAIAFALAKEQYDLILTCQKNIDLLEDLKEDLQRKYRVEVMTFCGDVSDYGFWEDLKAKTEERFPTVDVVINNAGISYVGLLSEMSIEDWHKVMNTNLTSVFYSSKLFTPAMIRQKSGHIINISSIWGHRGASCEVAYSASKGGMNAFTKALAKELAPSGVYVNSISCGVTDTDMNKIFSAEERALLEEEIPMGRFGTPKEVADAVIAILNTTYLTGQIIGVDGGFF